MNIKNQPNISFGTFKIKAISLKKEQEKQQLVSDLKAIDGVQTVLKGEEIPETWAPMVTRFLFGQFDRHRGQIPTNACLISHYYYQPFITANPELEEKIAQQLEAKGYNIEKNTNTTT